MKSTSPKEMKTVEQKNDLLHKIGSYLEKNSPGMRVIKTALAVIICLVIEYYRGGSSPYNASIATIVCMQPTLKTSFQSAVDRTFGTIIAGIYAYVFAVLLGQTWGIQPANINFYLLVGLLSFPLMALMVIIKKPSSLAITAIVYLLIMLTITETDPLVYTFERVVATLIGIAVALFVNWLPPLNKIGKKKAEGNLETV